MMDEYDFISLDRNRFDHCQVMFRICGTPEGTSDKLFDSWGNVYFRETGIAPIVTVLQGDTEPHNGVAVVFFKRQSLDYTVVEIGVVVDELHRNKGAGKLSVMNGMCAAAEAGYRFCVARILDDNEASIALFKSCGFIRGSWQNFWDVWPDRKEPHDNSGYYYAPCVIAQCDAIVRQHNKGELK